MAKDARPVSDPADRHLWEITAVREIGLTLLLIVALLAMYALRPLLVPILIGFVGAYVVNPVVGWIQGRLGIPRAAVSVTILLIGFAGVAGFAMWGIPPLMEQIDQLIERLPAYVDTLSNRHGVDLSDIAQALPSEVKVNPQTLLTGLAATTSSAFGFIGSIVGATAYTVMAVVLIVVMFVYFSARYHHIGEVREWIPARWRDDAWRLVEGTDKAFSAFVRGQLIVAAFTTLGFCVGFWLAGVPYWFVVSLIGGTFSLIPYGQMSGLVLAVGLKFLEAQAGDGSATGGVWSILGQPGLVYVVTQSAESWVITPLVQGQTVKLHPVTVIVVILAGGFLAGVLGMILAIPLTASAKIAFSELILPRIRENVDM